MKTIEVADTVYLYRLTDYGSGFISAEWRLPGAKEWQALDCGFRTETELTDYLRRLLAERSR